MKVLGGRLQLLDPFGGNIWHYGFLQYAGKI